MVYQCIYVESRKMVQMILFAKQNQRQRCKEKTCGHQGGEEELDRLGDWDGCIYTTDAVNKIDNQ